MRPRARRVPKVLSSPRRRKSRCYRVVAFARSRTLRGASGVGCPEARRARRVAFGGAARRPTPRAMAAVHARVSPLILECALLDVDAVTPGEDFSVRVRARSEGGPVRVRAIDVSWHGVERLDPTWVKPAVASASAPKAGTGLNPGERYIAKSAAGAVAEDVVVQPGRVVERDVRIRLPPGLPPSFRGAVARTSYFITCVAATADASREAPDPPITWERAHARVPLRVRAAERVVEKKNREPALSGTDFEFAESPTPSPSPSPSPSSSSLHALGVKTSPRSALGPNLGPESPGSPLAALRSGAADGGGFGGFGAARRDDEKDFFFDEDDAEEKNDADANANAVFNDVDEARFHSVRRGYNIAVADASAPSGRRTLAKVTPEPPFPRASAASRDVCCRMDFFDDDDDDDDAETSFETERETETSPSSDPAFLRACLHARTPRVVRVVASLETREAVDVTGGGLRSAGYDPSETKASSEKSGDEKHVLTRRRVWCETSAVVADVSSASFQLSAPREAPPSFEHARVAVSWFLRVQFSVAAPRTVSVSLNRGGQKKRFDDAAENAFGVSSPRMAFFPNGRAFASSKNTNTNTKKRATETSADAPPSVSEWCVPLRVASPPPNRRVAESSATQTRRLNRLEFGAAESRPFDAASSGSADANEHAADPTEPDDARSGRNMTRDSSLVALS